MDLEFVTFVDVMNTTPIFFIDLTSTFTESASIIEQILSAYSITVTFEPNRAQIELISRPITPPPTTKNSFGI